MQREFGGYLPLELPHGQELYTGAGVLRLNCGRNAIVAALRDAGAKKSTLPCTIGKSLCLIASIIRRPTPGMENTISVSIAPPRRVPNWRPTTVMIGINAFRNTCFTITTISF